MITVSRAIKKWWPINQTNSIITQVKGLKGQKIFPEKQKEKGGALLEKINSRRPDRTQPKMQRLLQK